jgi:nicotinate-nucleotide pyrophosphorylase (carboxylating)
MQQISQEQLLDFIEKALYEDVKDGDHTSLASVPNDAYGSARLLVKDDGVLAGVALAVEIFRFVDPAMQMKIHIQDGEVIKYGDIAFEVHAPSQVILKAERLALNCMQRMSGIATMTRKFVDLVADLPVTILDTRKTTPLLRFLEKWSVRIGGGTNYRDGLYDRIMIKDNHVDFCGSIEKAINKVHSYLKEKALALEITVEVRNRKELEEVLRTGGINRIMLDNFDTDTMRKAVALIDKQYEIEASGGITLETVRSYAETGVDFISVGALTHSYNSLDLSLKKNNAL